jgi:hypothetical protein
MVAASSSSTALAQDAQTQPQPQPQGQTGGPGESCRARADCNGGLRCVNQVCTDEHEGQACGATSDCGGVLKCIQNKCTTPGAASAKPASGSSDASLGDWLKFNPLDGQAHPFVGFVLAGGFDTLGATGNGSAVFKSFSSFDGAFLFALAAGVYLGNHQLSVEVAPVTFIYDAKAPGPVFEASANYAYFIPLTEAGSIRVYWPIRFGAGIFAGPDLNALGFAYFQARADLVGVAVQVGHLMIDFHLPSFRWQLTDKSGTQLHFLDWLFGMTVGYAF